MDDKKETVKDNVRDIEDYQKLDTIIKHRLGISRFILAGVMKDEDGVHDKVMTYIPEGLEDCEMVYLLQVLKDIREFS